MVWSLVEDKASVFDGFYFFRWYWLIIQCDVVTAVQDFFIHGQMLLLEADICGFNTEVA